MKADILSAEQELERILAETSGTLERVQTLKREVAAQEKALVQTADVFEKKLGKSLHKDLFVEFFKHPYVVIPQGRDRILVAVPKFVKGFQVGWLWKETESFYIYQFDQYSRWLGDAPAELLEHLDLKTKLDVTVEGNALTFPATQRDEVKKRLGYHLKNVGDTSAAILRGHEFDVLAESIENGCLPFRERPVSQKDLREPQVSFKLRPYQERAVRSFMEKGSVGVFYPTGAGKSFITMHIASCVVGKKLLVVPTRTLIEQWEAYFERWAPHLRHETKIVTYAGYHVGNDEFALTIYDECQRLPADTFSRLAVIKTKYRLGLSASPHREDGRESYIFALTGFPIGLNWQEYMETVGKSYHPIYVHVVRSAASKLRLLRELVAEKKKTMVFCDSLQLGRQAAQMLDAPFISGESTDRIETMKNARVCVVSRVGDLGVSLPDLQRIVEIDFLAGSRQQELQRSGRLLHSEKAERHDIVMTEGEFSSYGKRLWALQEKGFTIKIVS